MASSLLAQRGVIAYEPADSTAVKLINFLQQPHAQLSNSDLEVAF